MSSEQENLAVREEAYTAMLDAEANRRLFDRKLTQHEFASLALNVLSALGASGAVATVLVDACSILQNFVLLGTALVVVVKSVWRPERTADRLAEITREWKALQFEYRRLFKISDEGKATWAELRHLNARAQKNSHVFRGWWRRKLVDRVICEVERLELEKAEPKRLPESGD